jgi:biotin synthase
VRNPGQTENSIYRGGRTVREYIFTKAEQDGRLEREDVLELLSIAVGSVDYYRLLELAEADAHRRFGNKGQIYAQIGLNASPCPANCGFCSLAKDVFNPDNSFTLPIENVSGIAGQLAEAGADEIFLMTTADYDNEIFLKCGEAVRKLIPPTMRLVANVGDFDLSYASELRSAGFTGAYHIRRLGEGKDTQLDPRQRIKTLDAIKSSGLELYYCVEPIGPEHSYEEIADEIIRGRDYEADVMAVMKRVCVPGTALWGRGEIDSDEQAKICAVTELCVKPRRAMGVHEPDLKSLRAGANQIYAEVSVNPRDLSLKTETGRGASVAKAEAMLKETGWGHQRR